MLTDRDREVIKYLLDTRYATRSGSAGWRETSDGLAGYVSPLMGMVDNLKAELRDLRANHADALEERDNRITRLEEMNANQRETIGQRDKTIEGLQASYSSLWDTYTRVVANHDDLAVALKNEQEALQAQREAFRLLAETYDDLVARLDEKANTDQVSPRDGIKIPVRFGGGFASFAPLYQERRHGG